MSKSPKVAARQRTNRCPFGPRAIAAALCLLATGCPVTAPLPTASDIKEKALSGESGGKYYLYIPSNYDKRRAYPLVIACHGTNPWDDAWSQAREWAQFAEQKELIVAAPVLSGTHGDFPPPAPQQVERERADERLILDLVSSLKGAYNIAEEKVFLTGWSAGAYAVLFTGLRNPDVFRALAVRQGNFRPDYVEIEPDRLDRWQPIFVYYGSTDPLREDSIKCIAWLREQNMFVEQREVPGTHRRLEVGLAWDFFRTIIRERPWIRLRWLKPNMQERQAVKFWCESKPPFTHIIWEFGDGERSSETSPTHTYAATGRYEVTAKVSLKGGKSYARKIVVRIGPPGGGES